MFQEIDKMLVSYQKVLLLKQINLLELQHSIDTIPDHQHLLPKIFNLQIAINQEMSLVAKNMIRLKNGNKMTDLELDTHRNVSKNIFIRAKELNQILGYGNKYENQNSNKEKQVLENKANASLNTNNDIINKENNTKQVISKSVVSITNQNKNDALFDTQTNQKLVNFQKDLLLKQRQLLKLQFSLENNSDHQHILPKILNLQIAINHEMCLVADKMIRLKNGYIVTHLELDIHRNMLIDISTRINAFNLVFDFVNDENQNLNRNNHNNNNSRQEYLINRKELSIEKKGFNRKKRKLDDTDLQEKSEEIHKEQRREPSVLSTINPCLMHENNSVDSDIIEMDVDNSVNNITIKKESTEIPYHESPLDYDEIRTVVSILRQNSNFGNNCATLARLIIEYLRTKKIPMEPATEILDDAYSTIKVRSFPVEIKQDPTIKTSEKHKVYTIATSVQSTISRDTALGAYAQPNVEYVEKNGKLTPEYNLEKFTERKVLYYNIEETLKREASIQPNKISFGIVGMERCVKVTKRNQNKALLQALNTVGHVIVYYATPEKVIYIDPEAYNGITQRGDPIIEKALRSEFTFAGDINSKGKEHDIFGVYVHVTPMNKHCLAQDSLPEIQYINEESNNNTHTLKMKKNQLNENKANEQLTIKIPKSVLNQLGIFNINRASTTSNDNPLGITP